MVRSCQADEALEGQFESLLKRQAPPEIGLLLGRHASGGKVLLLGTVKTPSLEGLQPFAVESTGAGGGAAAGGGGKGKKPGSAARASAAAAGAVAVSVEAEWVVEHGRQVSRMLPGGLDVLGLYVYCSEPAAIAAAPQLVTALASLAAAAGASATAALSPASELVPQHLLLLHVDAGSRKQSLRALPVGGSTAASASALKPVELRYGPTHGLLALVRCWHGVDLVLPVLAGAAGKAAAGVGGGAAGQLRGALAELVAAEAERIGAGLFLAAGRPVDAAAPLGDALAAAAASSETDASGTTDALPLPTYDLTLLAPPPFCRSDTAPRGGGGGGERGQQGGGAGAAAAAGCLGVARLRGCVRGLAVVGRREAAGRALAELQADLTASLATRLELLVEEAERLREANEAAAAEAEAAGGSGAQGQGQGQGRGPGAAVPPLLAAPGDLAGTGGAAVALPRRVVMPWRGGACGPPLLCDYLAEGEGPEAAAERAGELLGLAGLGAGQVLESEQPPSAAAAPPGAWRPNALPAAAEAAAHAGGGKAGAAAAVKGSAVAPGEAARGGGLACSAAMAASAAVAALAAAVGWMALDK